MTALQGDLIEIVLSRVSLWMKFVFCFLQCACNDVSDLVASMLTALRCSGDVRKGRACLSSLFHSWQISFDFCGQDEKDSALLCLDKGIAQHFTSTYNSSTDSQERKQVYAQVSLYSFSPAGPTQFVSISVFLCLRVDVSLSAEIPEGHSAISKGHHCDWSYQRL